ncbi:hypothetical protein Tco_1484691 [Tanacetum coccineum]
MVKEALDRKYKELEESKPILEVLENYMTYQKNLDEVMIGRARLSSEEYGEEEKIRIVEHGLSKKMCDPGNFVLLVRLNGTVEMSALDDIGASVSVLPYCLFKNLGLGDPKPYSSNLTMADNTQAKDMGEVKNVRIQIGYQAYLVDFLVLDIPVDKELPLLLGRPFFRTCRAIIDMGRGTLCIDDGVIHHTYFPKPRAKAYLDHFELDEEDDWMSCFEVGRDEDGNTKYGPVAPSFLDIEGDMERALAMEAYFNPFKNIIVFKKLVDFLGKGLGMPRVADWNLFYSYKFEETLRNKMKFEYIHSDGDIFMDYSWEKALYISGDVYREWLCGVEKVLTLPEFTVLLGLYEEEELNHCLFDIHFTRLEVDDKLFSHEAFWKKIGTPTSTNPRTSLIKEPLMRVVHRLFVGSLVHRAGSKERCQKRDMWIMSALEESRGINLAWVIAEHLCKHDLGLKENSLICGGHYVTKIASSLGYLMDEEVMKCSKPIECEKWTSKMLANELDEDIYTLMQTGRVTPQPSQARRQRQELSVLGYEIGGSSTGFHGDNDFDLIVNSKDCVASDNDGDDMRD